MPSERAQSGTATILVVCSGNICRSPLAEQLLHARLADATHPVSVVSAGTIADDGAAMDAQSALLSQQYGGQPEAHLSRLLTERQIQAAQLVLTATRAHRAEVVSLVPRASRYTFTLRQFARLLEQIGDEQLAGLHDLESLVEEAAALRGFAVPAAGTRPEDDDIEDPYRQRTEVYERVGAQIDRVVASIAAPLRTVLA